MAQHGSRRGDAAAQPQGPRPACRRCHRGAAGDGPPRHAAPAGGRRRASRRPPIGSSTVSGTIHAGSPPAATSSTLSHRRSQLRESGARAPGRTGRSSRATTWTRLRACCRVTAVARSVRVRWRIGCSKGCRPRREIVCVSEAAPRRAGRVRHIVPASRVTVIPNGVHPTCSHRPDARADREARSCSVPLDRHGNRAAARRQHDSAQAHRRAARSRSRLCAACVRSAIDSRRRHLHARRRSAGQAARAGGRGHGAAVCRSPRAGGALPPCDDVAAAVGARRIRIARGRGDGLRHAGGRQPHSGARRGRRARRDVLSRGRRSSMGGGDSELLDERAASATGVAHATSASLAQARRFSWREHARRDDRAVSRDLCCRTSGSVPRPLAASNEHASHPAPREVLHARSRRHRDRRRDAVPRRAAAMPTRRRSCSTRSMRPPTRRWTSVPVRGSGASRTVGCGVGRADACRCGSRGPTPTSSCSTSRIRWRCWRTRSRGRRHRSSSGSTAR